MQVLGTPVYRVHPEKPGIIQISFRDELVGELVGEIFDCEREKKAAA